MVENKENINQEEEQSSSVPMWLIAVAGLGLLFGALGFGLGGWAVWKKANYDDLAKNAFETGKGKNTGTTSG